MLLVVACGKSSSKSEPAPAPPPSKPADPPAAAKPPPDDLDEKMRHCPLALPGASSVLTDIDGGVQFEVTAPAERVAEIQRRAHHVVEFAAKRHDPSTHGVSDKQGGGTMRNCPVVTSDTVIAVTDRADGAVITVTVSAEKVAELRAETRRRTDKFDFDGATIAVK